MPCGRPFHPHTWEGSSGIRKRLIVGDVERDSTGPGERLRPTRLAISGSATAAMTATATTCTRTDVEHAAPQLAHGESEQDRNGKKRDARDDRANPIAHRATLQVARETA